MNAEARHAEFMVALGDRLLGIASDGGPKVVDDDGRHKIRAARKAQRRARQRQRRVRRDGGIR